VNAVHFLAQGIGIAIFFVTVVWCLSSLCPGLAGYLISLSFTMASAMVLFTPKGWLAAARGKDLFGHGVCLVT